MRYHFGSFELNTETVELRNGGVAVPLEPQAFRLLTFLIEHRERVVSKDELLEHLWSGKFVSEATLTTAVKLARAGVDDTGTAQRTIRTVRGHGYRFVGEITNEPSIETPPAPTDPPATTQAEPPQLKDYPDRLFSAMALLPFDNRSDNTELDKLIDAIHEDVAAGWIGRAGHRLIATSETRRPEYKDASAQEVTQALDVGMLLRGQVRELGGQLRFLVELVDATGEQIWIHRFNEDPETVFDRLDHIVDMIIWNADQKRWLHLLALARKLDEKQLEPFGIGLKAMAHYDMRDAEQRQRTRTLYETAIARAADPSPFKSMLAYTLAGEVVQGFSTDPQADSERALRLAEDVVTSSTTPQLLMNAGNTFGLMGDSARALALCRRAYEMYPRNRGAQTSFAERLLYSGHTQEALSLYEQILTTRLPGQPTPYELIAQCHTVLGNTGAGLEMAQRAYAENALDVITVSTYANLLVLVGRENEARQVIARLQDRLPAFKVRSSIKAYHRAFPPENAEALTAGLEALVDSGQE